MTIAEVVQSRRALGLLSDALYFHTEEIREDDEDRTDDLAFADEVAAANVDLEIKIFPTESLFKAREQYTPLSRGQLDMTVFPLSYAGGQRPEYNLTLMPGLVKNHDHAARLNESDFMKKLEDLMAQDDVRVLAQLRHRLPRDISQHVSLLG